MELLIPTLSKIIRSRDSYFGVTMNNDLKTISVRGSPLYIMGGFFSKKKSSHERTKTFLGKKILGRLF